MPSFRPIGVSGAYPDWLRAVANVSGVYAILERYLLGGWQIVYVGECHSNKLKKTVVRHFQAWSRAKSFWAGQYREQTAADPGRTYNRAECEVAIQVCKAGRAVDLQNKWIRDMDPRDNIKGVPMEEVPF